MNYGSFSIRSLLHQIGLSFKLHVCPECIIVVILGKALSLSAPYYRPCILFISLAVVKLSLSCLPPQSMYLACHEPSTLFFPVAIFAQLIKPKGHEQSVAMLQEFLSFICFTKWTVNANIPLCNNTLSHCLIERYKPIFKNI